jgi:hypothetical protein
MALPESTKTILKQGTRQELLPNHNVFGFMKDTGKILGDIVAPVLPENA